MEVILTAFNSCFPLLLLVALGYLLKRIGYIGPTTINQMSKIVLDVFLPINIFMGVAKGKLSNDLSITYLILLFGIQVGAIIINCLIIGKRKMISQQKSIILQDAVRGNCSLFALPLSILIAGNTISSFAALSVAISSPVINTYSIVNFEYFKSKDHKIFNILKKLYYHH